jgi:beta-galactosidase
MCRSALLVGAVWWALLGAASASAQGQAVALPSGVRAVWDMDRAYRQATPTRESICINGLWRWQPATTEADAVPADGWGYFKVPGPWPGITAYMQKDCQTLFPNPAWAKVDLRTLKAAWYERTFTVPAGWAGRRVTVTADCLSSFAVVYVDGKRVGETRFPGGEVDVTAACSPGREQALSVLVIAMPLKGVLLSISDPVAAAQVEDQVPRRGLCGDVYLVGAPAGARVEDLKVDTSVRRWQITFDAALGGLPPDAPYRLTARISDHGQPVTEFTSDAFTAADLKEGRYAFMHDWHPDKLWDTITPQNQYDVQLTLTDADGKVLDATLPVRFGFREFWIDGRDFCLNGTRIYLSAVRSYCSGLGVAWATYESALDTMKRLQSIGINYVYTFGYGCTPGSHLDLRAILRAADDCGMLVGFTMPHFRNYDWTAPDADETNGYARTAASYVRIAEDHPSVVFYVMSHNGIAYAEQDNPETIDGSATNWESWTERNMQQARRAQAIVEHLDPTRIVYHHAGGNIGDVYTLNFYPNFVPVQELDDWFGHWASVGVKPFMACEYAAPFPFDWTMFRGWYEGTFSYGGAQVPWQICVSEWNAQFLGDQAFLSSQDEREDLIWEANQLRAGKVWYRWQYPHPTWTRDLAERAQVRVKYLTDNWRAYRTWGVSGVSPWVYGIWWTLRQGTDTGRAELPVDWDHLQRPGYSPDYVEQQFQDMAYSFRASDWQPAPTGEALIRNNGPVLAYIGGRPGDFTEKGHNFTAGETVRKQIIIINNSRRTQTCDCSWSFGLPSPLEGSRQIAVETGEQARIPLEFTLPDSAKPGQYGISATVRFSSGETQTDTFAVDVVAAPTRPKLTAKVALFDPKAETSALLERMGVRYESVGAGADLSPYDMLVVGKEALSIDGPAPDISRVRDGLRVVVFEQSSDALAKRLGFRTIEYGLRNVFERVPASPLLGGLNEEELHDWRGEATLTAPRLHYKPGPEWLNAPTVEWAGLMVPQVWRCGNRGNVCSVLIEKPACGDFLPVLDGGFSLQYSPLMLYREGKGMVLFCEMDVTGRSEDDPAAERLASNVLSYVQTWQPRPIRTALYDGGEDGLAHLQASGLVVRPYAGGPPSADQVLVVTPGGPRTAAASTGAIAGWLKAGGHLLAIGLDEQEANAFLPAKVTMKSAEYISTTFIPADLDPLTVGVGPADVHNRDPRQVPLITGGARPIGDGVMARGEGGNVVFYQLVPWTFDTKVNSFKRTFRRTAYAVSRLLANMGCEETTPLLERFSKPAGADEARYLSGLYLDQPEVWDDPYRFFEW